MTENETTELKTSLAELKQGLISLAAMLNKHCRAELWFGVAPDGRVLGLDANEKTLRDVSQAISAHIEPVIYPKIVLQPVDGKHCLKIEAEGWQRPYFAYGRAYIRVADEDKKLTASELTNLILKNSRDAIRWEDEPCGLSIEQLVPAKINAFLERAGLPVDAPASALDKLGLLRDGQPVNAAKLFFAPAPIELRCAVFAGATSATILDRHDFSGDLLGLLQESEKYILSNIHIGMRLSGLYRVDVPEIPLRAIREALINAFCHRDWRDPDFVQVAIFKNRLEIRSPGGLYDGLTLSDIRSGNVSRRRNPKVAELLRRVHLVEAWGRGVPLILEAAPNATFSELGGLFVTSFPRVVEARGRESAGVMNVTGVAESRAPYGTGREVSASAAKTIREHAVSDSDWSAKAITTSRECADFAAAELILRCLRERPQSTARELALRTGLTESGVRYHLARFKRQGRLRRIGSTKAGTWEVIGAGD
ncbi:MAG: putative DNA binding domain-containing protein [Deltaproteobacteria bacterium]|nr:putative DNA binding domain-containing protein [Deltaproteobacteria bacterium]